MDLSHNVWFLVAALADLTGVFVHGVLGHRVMMSPLTRERLFSTPDFGDTDMSWRIFAVTWHVVTAVFGCCGLALLLLASGMIEGQSLPFFISALHAAFLVVAVAILGARAWTAFRRPIPLTFALCMTTACLASWLAMR